MNWTKRVAILMKKIRTFTTLRDSCYRLGCVSLGKNCQRHIDKWDDQLVKIIKPRLEGVTVAGEISQADIDSANSHPIENLFPDHKKMKICCIFHNDKNPSASIAKNNRLMCFSACGKSFSVIDCYMKLNRVGFTEAVKALR